MGNPLGNLRRELVKTSKKGFSLELRLVILFLFFLMTIMLCISLILVSTGVFNAGMKEHTALFKRELSHLSQSIYHDFGDVSLRSVSLAEQLSKGIEAILLENGIMPSQLSEHPQLIETILARKFDLLLNELQHSRSSGVFLMLDATVNPHVEGAENSRAGLFLKNMEATAVSSIYYNIRYMRGPASIGRSTRMTILPQWKMEFDVRDACYFKIPMATVAKSDLSLSRLYYWCPKTDFDDSDSAMLCSVPLIASDGTVLGVAGFEMSSMLFRLKYTPNNSSANRLFCMLAPSDSTYLQMKNAMFAGSYSVSEVIPSAQMTVQNNTNGLNEYLCNDNSYFGLDNKVRLYAANSPYEQEEWSVVLLAPKEDIAEQVIKQNRSIVLLLVLLTAACVVLSIRISRKYLRPVRSAFDTIKLQKVSEFSKTRIPEIDDLIQYLAIQDEKTEKHAVDSSAHDTAMFETFVDNIKKLSMAERAVFDLYLEGHTAKEIAQILCLSINTIKTHNRRIYMKLNVTSRKELLVYTHMMQELAEEERFSGTDGS